MFTDQSDWGFPLFLAIVFALGMAAAVGLYWLWQWIKPWLHSVTG